MSKLLLFILLFCPFDRLQGENNKKYYLSICAMFQDEAEYLKEWIEYHRLVGVEHFYLYNNNSDDNFLEILQPYIVEKIVELTEWSRPNKDDYWLEDQKRAYNDCVARCKRETEWLAIIDIDEFIVPVIHDDLPAFLLAYDNRPDVGGIRANWQLYGSSHLTSIPKDKLLIESLIWKAPTNYISEDVPHNGIVKSIVRPKAVKLCRAHECDYKKGYRSLPVHGETRFQPVQVDTIRINHYWTRAEDFFYEVKIKRRMTYADPNYKKVMLQKLKDLNQVEDPIMLKFAPKLKERMG